MIDSEIEMKELAKCPQHKIVYPYIQTCPMHHCRRKKLLQWSSINTHTHTPHTHTHTYARAHTHTHTHILTLIKNSIDIQKT